MIDRRQADDPEHGAQFAMRTDPVNVALLNRKRQMAASGISVRGAAHTSLFATAEAARIACSHPSVLPQSSAITTASAFMQPDGLVAWIDNMNQQTQRYSSWCGAAVVSKISYSIGVPVSQETAAVPSWTNSVADAGTSREAMGVSLNNVARSKVGWNYYAVEVPDYNITQAQRDTFHANIGFDVRSGWPLGVAILEEPGVDTEIYIHLPGHPQMQWIRHWIEIGGYWYAAGSPDNIYHADSAQNPWPSTPTTNWYPERRMGTLIGGASYYW